MKKIQHSKSHILKFQGQQLQKTEKELDPSKEGKIYKNYLLQLKQKEADEPYIAFANALEISKLFEQFHPSYKLENYEKMYSESRNVIEQALDADKFHNLKRAIINCPLQFQSTFIKRLLQVSMQRQLSDLKTALQFCSYLYEKNIVSKTIIRRGVDRLVADFNEVIVDVPKFPVFFILILQSFLKYGIIREKYILRIPDSLFEFIIQNDEDGVVMQNFKSEIDFRAKKSVISGQILQTLEKQYENKQSQVMICEMLSEYPNEGVKTIFIENLLRFSLNLEQTQKIERISKILEFMSNEKKIFNYSDFAFAFDSIIWNISSFSAEKAIQVMTKFIVRATADRVLPPRYVIEGEAFDHLSEECNEIAIYAKSSEILKSGDLEMRASQIWKQ